MYSSSAYQTSTSLSDLVTREQPAAVTQIGTRPDDTTAGFSVGLIPQLIDVLRILTEGQDLLSRKIRTAVLEESSHSIAIDEQVEHIQFPAAPPTIDSGSPPAGSRVPTSSDIHFEDTTTRADTVDCDPTSDPGVEVAGADIPSSSKPGFTPVSDRLMATRGDASDDHSNEPVVQSALLGAAPDETAASPLRRDYNFFDELDARLAGLGNSTG